MSEQDVREIVARLETVRMDALLRGDVATLDDITSDRYIHIESTGRRRSKAEFLDGLARAEFRFESFDIEENRIIARPEFAYAVGSYRNRIRTREGLNPVKHARHVRIYEKENGVWRNVFHQATESTT
ncbi:nuclear transport factor 2 family protein [Sphingobium lactosutens]|uniref:DUF4440 domain-containing protein n=1 Tax=Sphingobium lactosutens DS20 TaxID=1331060 RepID=T0HDS3_9SPHN|nr:nuclear transport factor 2 family protein [Sphingobium lactosutens]EQB11152.1 hypothetical protein RLDS_24980 [Sphingobium lactosutens DS20]